MIVTIDGPAGAGKSTVARALADRLGFDFLDTGATYRTVALAAQRAGVAIDQPDRLNALLDGTCIRLQGRQVLLNDEDVSQAIRTPAITALSRAVADSPIVREHLTRLQRALAKGRDVVTEGRDQGTIVFPHAECKFFLFADPLARAERRYRELRERGEPTTLEQVVQDQADRDARDAEREIAPMKPAPDAIHVDSTSATVDEVVELMAGHVRSRMRTT